MAKTTNKERTVYKNDDLVLYQPTRPVDIHQVRGERLPDWPFEMGVVVGVRKGEAQIIVQPLGAAPSLQEGGAAPQHRTIHWEEVVACFRPVDLEMLP